ncbi:MaoC family dehydratase [Porticoccaceae bacterium]|nr:MaoC family dehydratase [Porticoccaceae bacterium]
MTSYGYPAYIDIADKRYRERFGLDFEDFVVGQRFRHRPGYTFTQQDNSDECKDTLNQAMLHFDAHYTSHTEFKQPLMVTTVIVQRLIGMMWKTFQRRKRILGWGRIDMLAPVFAGDTLYAESEIMTLNTHTDDPECGGMTVCVRSYNQHGKLTCEMSCDMLVYKAASLPFAANNY